MNPIKFIKYGYDYSIVMHVFSLVCSSNPYLTERRGCGGEEYTVGQAVA